MSKSRLRSLIRDARMYGGLTEEEWSELDALAEVPRPIDLVREFHVAFGRPVRDVPDVGTPEERVLRVRLMLEEVLEFARAAGIGVSTAGHDGIEIEGLRDLDIYPIAYGATPDLVAMTHELADIRVVVDGTAVQLGLPVEEALAEEIHPANMRKLGPDGRPIVDSNGKVRKPDGWVPADVGRVLGRFTRSGEQTPECDADSHKVNGFCPTCSDGFL